MDFLLGALYSRSSSLSLCDQINSVPRNQIISLCRCYEYRNAHTLSDCLLFASSPLEMGEGQVQSTLAINAFCISLHGTLALTKFRLVVKITLS